MNHTSAPSKTRTESDSFGPIKVSADALWAAQWHAPLKCSWPLVRSPPAYRPSGRT